MGLSFEGFEGIVEEASFRPGLELWLGIIGTGKTGESAAISCRTE